MRDRQPLARDTVTLKRLAFRLGRGRPNDGKNLGHRPSVSPIEQTRNCG